jgi:2-methylcitrate dehydratase PrpD
MHRSFDSAVNMLAGRSLGPGDIDEIEVTMGKGQTAVLTFDRPKTGLEAKFSEQFAMAAAVVLGRMGIADLADNVVQRRDIQDFFPKVKLNAVDEHDDRDPAHSPTERVRIKLARGEILDSGPIASIRGHASDPMSADELWVKFAECTAQAYAPHDARHAFDLLRSVDAMRSARELPSCKATPIG